MSHKVSIEDTADMTLDEKIEFVQQLWDVIAADADSVPLSDEQRRIIQERLADHERYPSATVPWEQVRRELLGEYEAASIPLWHGRLAHV